MRNSAYHPLPSVVVATVQLPSQFLLNPPPEPDWKRCRELNPPPWKRPPPRPSLATCPSYSIPVGVVPKTKPFWSSL